MGTTFKFENKLNIFGNIIKKYREANSISVENLSGKLALLEINLPADSICQIENNKRSIKDYELAGMSAILNFSVDEEFKKFIDTINKD